MDIPQQREAAYAEAAKLNSRDGSSAVWRQPFPTRYTSDPDVINSPAETIKVKAQWATYFKAMDDALIQYPYTDEELARRPNPCEPTEAT